MNEQTQREIMVEIGRRLWQRNMVAANAGNFSVKLADNMVIATPTGVSKGFMTPDMMVKVDFQGNTLEGDGKASSEIKMHIAVYEARPDIVAVMHAHPVTATAFAVAGQALDQPILTEVVPTLGPIPLAPYATPSTDEVPDSIRSFLPIAEAILLANHGALTYGKDLWDAYYKMEILEHSAQVALTARTLGGAQSLTDEQVQQLLDLK
ncbi:MAG: class II aldolase/adducin family protein [Armatimonadetes bacterium]|nr:class II aldolase/adducin family protein [Armatimonadota bacterium]